MDSETKPLSLASEANTSNNFHTSMFYSQFLYKAFILALIWVIVPQFPSQVPEFINLTVSTRSWELLHLLFVGLVVSYGLFSTRTDETLTEKGNPASTFDNAQSYVSKLLQVSSIFDEEGETTIIGNDVSKVQTWSNRYSRGEPVVVVANENSVVDECRGFNGSIIAEKPLFLPVRSLKCFELRDEYGDDDGDVSRSVSRSNSNFGSKQSLRNGSSSSNTRNADSRGLVNPFDFEGKAEGNGVLPSPIPWRSRSERMELKEEENDNNGSPMYTLPPSMEESGFNSVESRFSKPHSTKSSTPNAVSSLKSSELQAKNVDLVRKKSIQKSSSPPPPPPPPMSRKPPLESSSANNNVIYPDKEYRRIATSGQIELRTNGSEDMLRRVNAAVEAKSRTHVGATIMEKTVGTTRSGDIFGLNRKFQEELECDNEVDVDASLREKTGKKTVRFNQTLVAPKEEEFMDEVEHQAASDGTGPDVDKKADEFIAKFREQIRLQRTASIKRSSGEIDKNPPR